MDSSQSKWSTLGRDVLENIAKRLDTRTDILRLRAVCTAWRSLIPKPPRNYLTPDGSPLKLPCPIGLKGIIGPMSAGHLLLKESTIYCVEPLTDISSAWNTTKNWFINIEEADSGSEKVRLKEPLSRLTIKNLGKINSLPNKVINLLEYRVREVGKAYNFCINEFSELKSDLITKVVVGFENKDKFSVMALHTGVNLGVWKMGDKKWAQVHDSRKLKGARYDDIAYHNGRFYAVDFTGLTIAVDPSSLKVTQVASPMFTYGHQYGGLYKYLVNSLGDLYLVDKFIDINVNDSEGVGSTPHLEVYKLDEGQGRWISVKNLGNQVMFVGDTCCYSVSASDFAGLKGNCVYFVDGLYASDKDDFLGSDTGLFNLEDEIAQPLKSVVGYSKIFWPPPTWLGQNPSSKAIIVETHHPGFHASSSTYLHNQTVVDSSPSKWSTLRRDMLEEISKCLDTRTEILRLRAVCTAWRSQIPLPPSNNLTPDGLPLKLPFPIGPNKSLDPRRAGHFLLKESIIYCVEPLTKIANAWKTTKHWFIKIEEADSGCGKVRLKDPLSRFTIKNLGKINNLPNKVINLLDYRVREVGKAYDLELVEIREFPLIEFNELKSIRIKKVVVGFESKDKFWVMAVHTGKKLGIWKMGDKKWAQIDDCRERARALYEDIAYHNGRFYAVDCTGLTIAVDPSSLEVTQVAPPMFSYGPQYCGLHKYLVNSLGHLYLVDHINFDNVIEDSDGEGDGSAAHLNVYKLDEGQAKWISVKSLGNQVMFVGDTCCYSVSASDFAGLKGNCIYFTDDCFSGVKDDFPGWDAGLFDLEDETTQPLKSVVGCSKIFWPPPTWLGPRPSPK